MDNKHYIRKVILSDGTEHYFYDDSAVHKTGDVVEGDLKVNGKITSNELFIQNITETENVVDNVLTSVDGLVMKRDSDRLLEDIGGTSFSFNEENGLLSFKIGK